jgi:hypothetical protein
MNDVTIHPQEIPGADRPSKDQLSGKLRSPKLKKKDAVGVAVHKI